MDLPPLSNSPLQISASALIATLHQTFINTQYKALRIDSTSTIYLGPNIEETFISAVWEHAYRRAEDQALLVMPTHPASTTVFYSAVSAFPNANPAVGQALNVLTPFFTALTKHNISTRFHNGLGVTYSLNSKGDIISTRIELPDQPFTSLDQLTNLPSSKSDRVFDVFYHLLLAESDRAEHLSLKQPQDYDLLKNGTFELPEWVKFSDDYALAKDWSDGLRQCGIKGAALRGVLSTLSGILLLGNRSVDDQQEGCALLGLDPSCLNTHSVKDLIRTAYVKLVENVVAELNHFLSKVDATFEANEADNDEDPNEVIAVVSIIECAPSSKATILNNVFDNTVGINSELNDDGVQLSKTPGNVTRALTSLRQQQQSGSIDLIDGFRSLVDEQMSYLANIKPPTELNPPEPLVIEDLAASSRIWNILNVAPCADAEAQSRDVWSSQLVSAQIRGYYVTEWATKRKNIDFSADFGLEEFIEKYNSVMPPDVGFYELEAWARQERNWPPTEFYCGSNRVWISENVWRDLEMDLLGYDEQPTPPMDPFANNAVYAQGAFQQDNDSVRGPPQPPQQQYPPQEHTNPFDSQSAMLLGDYDKRNEGYETSDDEDANDHIPIDEEYLKKYHGDLENNAGMRTKQEVVKMTSERRAWVWFVWMLTFWIPSPVLNYILRMKRSEVRMAWREKLVICFLITLLNGAIIFYMIFLGTMICPDYDKVWSLKEINTHQGDDDFYVNIRGDVYDISKFYRQHANSVSNMSPDQMMMLAGQDVSDYFLPPLSQACPGLVKDDTLYLEYNTTSSPYNIAVHGPSSPYRETQGENWYKDSFEPKIKEYHKGRRVETADDVKKKVDKDPNAYWFIIDKNIYDISNYFITLKRNDPSNNEALKKYHWFPEKFLDIVQNNQGGDVTEDMRNKLDAATRDDVMTCLKNTFALGEIDFRKSAKCQVSNYILLAIAGILTSVTVVKFLASIKFGGKKMPSPQNNFVVCQIPAYTESEDALRLAIDSLTSLKYENSRKLLFVICDGMIVGAGNDRTTPQIVLDLFGVDDRIDPEPKEYFAIGEGAKQLNRGKVYSGLYEFEGNVVPYMVVVKIGRKEETSRPGNRGKRDSQIMLMNFFNKVHYQTPMSPLELEIFHQLNNVIGVDPELYEYLFMVDADTSVSEDALTRLVAQCQNDSRVAGTCGETSLQNEEKSWATMIQVYEYFISHHLTKAFESLFGSVTCLPGCFSLYRMRTTKKFKPLIISNDIIREYSECNVDTLHKKNLFSLGEDRYLTTLITKYFPRMKLTFVAEAFAQTAAPEEFSVLLSQRRRWINSTVHNLVELLRLNDMCGFCCFGMRGVVFIDLVGTMMLPSVVIYLGWLIYRIASHTGPLPLISIILIASVYGLQALVFILRRQWQHIGWMIIYLAAYPIHSFLLPIYSFWNMDNFTWGNTRVVLGEKNGKQVVAVDDGGFDPTQVPLETWKSYAIRCGYKGAERSIVFDERKGRLQNQVFEDDYGAYDMQELDSEGRRKTIYDIEQASRMDGGASVYSGSRPMSTFSEMRSVTPFTMQRQSLMSPSHSRMSLATSNRMSAFGGAPSRMSVVQSVNDQAPPVPSLYEDPERDAQISETIRQVLDNADLDNMTKRQLREKVQDMMGIQFTAEKIPHVDQLIDEELEKLDEESDDGEIVDELKSL